MIFSNECWMNDHCKKYPNCEKFCTKLFKLDNLYTNAQIPINKRKHVNLRIDADGTDRNEFIQLNNIMNNIENFVSQGKCLYIHSSTTGNGKTSWAKRAIEEYLESIWWKSDLTCKALFISIPRFTLALKASISVPDPYVTYVNENVLKADIVVLDEIGIKAATTFEMEHLLNIINTRIDLGKSNIYTSNLSDTELLERLGDRLYSRIARSSVNIELKGSDKRGVI